MSEIHTNSHFNAKLLRPESSADDMPTAFVILPKAVSATLPRRGRTTVAGTMNGYRFQVMLEPDGKLSHWLALSAPMLKAAGVGAGDSVTFEIHPVEHEPEPDVPLALHNALNTAPLAKAGWDDTTTIARVDWIHWITSAKQAKTRAQRLHDACAMLASG